MRCSRDGTHFLFASGSRQRVPSLGRQGIASVYFVAFAARFGSKLNGMTVGEQVGLSPQHQPIKVGRIRDPCLAVLAVRTLGKLS